MLKWSPSEGVSGAVIVKPRRLKEVERRIAKTERFVLRDCCVSDDDDDDDDDDDTDEAIGRILILSLSR